MNVTYLNEQHKEALEKSIRLAGLKNEANYYKKVPLYVLTSIPVFQDLDKLALVFNFDGGYFDPDAIYKFELSTGESILFGLAMNLFNGHVYKEVEIAPYQAMSWLSKEYKQVFLSAMEYRFVNNVA